MVGGNEAGGVGEELDAIGLVGLGVGEAGGGVGGASLREAVIGTVSHGVVEELLDLAGPSRAEEGEGEGVAGIEGGESRRLVPLVRDRLQGEAVGGVVLVAGMDAGLGVAGGAGDV